jgi:RIO-like serine/threonine protein kinase
MTTYIIYLDNKEIKRFEGQTSDLKPLMFIQRHQGQSLSYALKYSGYKVEEINETTQIIKNWKY